MNWARCAALAAMMSLGLAAGAQAQTATFTFTDETGGPGRGVLVLDDYVPLGGTFVSWKYYRGLVLDYEVTASDIVSFSSNLDNMIVGSNTLDNIVRIETATSLFETGLEDPNGGVALLWNLTLNPVCDPGTPCGGGDGPLIDNGPPFTYLWTLNSLTARGAVPEPMTWALMIGGFGVTGAQLRARRRRAA